MANRDLTRAHLYKDGTEWVVWIPPTIPEHWDRYGSQVGPAGDYYAHNYEDALRHLIENT